MDAQRVDPAHVGHVDHGRLSPARDEARERDELDDVACGSPSSSQCTSREREGPRERERERERTHGERSRSQSWSGSRAPPGRARRPPPATCRLGRESQGLCDRHGERGDAPDGEDLANVLGLVRRRRDDQGAVEQVDRDPVRRLVPGAAYPRHAPVRRHDDNGRELGLERAVEEREALDVEHVHLRVFVRVGQRRGFSSRSLVEGQEGRRRTSSMKRTPGTISALPSSRQSLTLALIWSRSSDLISPVSPA